jgi:hypothetical protein
VTRRRVDGRRFNAFKHGLTAAPPSVLNRQPTGLTAALLDGLPPSDDLREAAKAFVVQWHRYQAVQKHRREALQAFMETRGKDLAKTFESPSTRWFIKAVVEGPDPLKPTWPTSANPYSADIFEVVERRLAVLAGYERKIASLRRKAVSRFLIEVERVAGSNHR